MDYQRIPVYLIGNAMQDAEVKQGKETNSRYGDFRLAVRNRAEETVYCQYITAGGVRWGQAVTAPMLDDLTLGRTADIHAADAHTLTPGQQPQEQAKLCAQTEPPVPSL